VQSIAVGNGPAGVALAGGAVWVANPPDGTLTRVDPGTGAVRKVPVAEPGALAATAGSLWVARRSRRDVARLDPRSGRLLGRIPLGAPAAAIAPEGDGLAIATPAAPNADRGGTLRVSGGQGVYSVDPGQVYSTPGWAIVSQVYDGLVTYARRPGPAGAAIVPDLAASLPVVRDGGLTLTLRLRPGIRYSNGRIPMAVRAADVRASLERQFRAGTGLGRLGVPLRGADGCTKQACDLRAGVATDEAARTVTLRVSRPDPELLHQLALPFGAVVPAGSPPIGGRHAPLPGIGPYRIARFRADRTLVLERNRSFRVWSEAAQPAGFPDRLVFSLSRSPDRQRAAFEAGRADVALDSPPVAALPRLARQRPLSLHRYAVSPRSDCSST
jgi:peptide/nickel transport system substrate-binding protein